MKSKIKKFFYKGAIVSMTLFLLSAGSTAFSAQNSSIEQKNEKNNDINKNISNELKKTTVYIVGDSTACEYGVDENYAIPRAGWGMYLSDYLNTKASVVDLALGGRSSKSFISEPEYKELCDNLKKGDYLIIQFGHNDEKNKNEEDLKNRYTNPDGDIKTEGSFKNSLYTNYIKLALDKDAYPILVSPVSRRGFNESNKIKDSHGLYDDAVRELAKELDIPFVDLTQLTADLYEKLGVEKTAALHALYYDRSKGENGIDNTHYSHYGAKVIAMLFADNIPNSSISLKNYRNNIITDGSFEDDNISRGDFVSLLTRMVTTPIDKDMEIMTEKFPDVKSNDKNLNYILRAKNLGITKGDKFGNFNPNNFMTQEEFVTFSARALKYYENEIGGFKNNISDLFDYSPYEGKLQNYAIDSIKYIKGIGLSFADSALSNYQDYVSNEEAIKALYEMYSFIYKNSDNKETQTIEDLEKVENTK